MFIYLRFGSPRPPTRFGVHTTRQTTTQCPPIASVHLYQKNPHQILFIMSMTFGDKSSHIMVWIVEAQSTHLIRMSCPTLRQAGSFPLCQSRGHLVDNASKLSHGWKKTLLSPLSHGSCRILIPNHKRSTYIHPTTTLNIRIIIKGKILSFILNFSKPGVKFGSIN